MRPDEYLGTHRGLLSHNTNPISIRDNDVSSISELSQPNLMSPVSSQFQAAGMLDELSEEKFKGLGNSEPRGKPLFWSPAVTRGAQENKNAKRDS